MPTTDKFAPKFRNIRDPRDPKKKFGQFWNGPRYPYFGGAPQGNKLNQEGDRKPDLTPQKGQDATGPISDRGHGRT